MRMSLYLIGIDDTDIETSRGTGQLARRLVVEAVSRGATHRGITRHQFLVDPQIPYTRRNRGVCIAIDWPGAIPELEFAIELLAEWSADGSDPGICIAAADTVPEQIIEFGRRASREVLKMQNAIALAALARITLRTLGGTGQGIIGALSCVGLRAGGNDGRFVDLPGLRDLGPRVSIDDLSRIGIEVQHEMTAGARADVGIETLGWIRPRLVGGRPVLPVIWSSEHDAWIPLDQKRIHTLD
jgi:hypothetical protein